ncbi:hypothetical protein KSP39_PZI000274 [Platanthera zijinensis]|uniref:Uncharacterized protein n=1 Tax=Platanthera zijinensis TaxID=2320716 RepID=A0AAP0C2E6_9ASPA
MTLNLSSHYCYEKRPAALNSPRNLQTAANISGFKKAIQTLCFSDLCFSDRCFSDGCNGAKQSLAARVIADTRFIYIPIIFLFVAGRFPTPLPRFYKAASPVLKSRRCQNLLPFSALLALLQVRNFGYGFSSPSLQKVLQIRNFELTISNRVLGPSVHWAGMLPRVLHAEDGKDLTHRIHSKSSLLKIVKYFGPLLILAAVFFIFGARYFDAQVLKLQPTRSNFFPCIKLETNDLNRLIKPPSILSHNMSDAELFWAASFVPQVKKYPFKRVAKAAFMFLTRGPLPLSPLWEKFFKGNEALYSIYIHSLPSYEASYPKHSVFYKRQIPSQILFHLVPSSFARLREFHIDSISITGFLFTFYCYSCLFFLVTIEVFSGDIAAVRRANLSLRNT